MKPVAPAIVACIFLATPTLAATQLERSVDLGLRQHGFEVPIGSLDRTTLTRLSFALSNDDAGEGDVRTRNLIKAILSQAQIATEAAQ